MAASQELQQLPHYLPLLYFILRRQEETGFICLLTTRSELQAADWTCSGRSSVSSRKLVGTSVGSENLWTHAGFCIFSFETRGIISASGVYDSVRGLSGWRRQMPLNKAENVTSLLVCFPQSYEDSKGRGTVHNEEEKKKKKNFMKLCLTNSSLVVPSCKLFHMNFFLSLS